MRCTFFGHSDTPQEKRETLKAVIIDLVKNNGVDTFYVGNHGNFDKMAYKILCELSDVYNIKFFVVLSCVPIKESNGLKNTIVPEGIENVPPRFGIVYRNKWMINNSDYVVTYVNRSFGGAAKFKEYAEKKKRIVINVG